MHPLSAGVCAWLNRAPLDEIDGLNSGYTVQLLSLRKLKQTTRTAEIPDRYQVTLSDGAHWVRAVLSTHLNDLVYLGDVVKFAIVVIDVVTCTILRDTRIIVILGLHVISRDEKKIGNPVAAPSSAAPITPS